MSWGYCISVFFIVVVIVFNFPKTKKAFSFKNILKREVTEFPERVEEMGRFVTFHF